MLAWDLCYVVSRALETIVMLHMPLSNLTNAAHLDTIYLACNLLQVYDHDEWAKHRKNARNVFNVAKSYR